MSEPSPLNYLRLEVETKCGSAYMPERKKFGVKMNSTPLFTNSLALRKKHVSNKL